MATDSTAFHFHAQAPAVWLVGAGTVGRAILGEFLRGGYEVLLIDANEEALLSAGREAQHSFPNISLHHTRSVVNDLPALRFASCETNTSRDTRPIDEHPWPMLVLESIPENLPLKQSLFADLRKAMPKEVILASNTSNLRINDVFARLSGDPRCCGLHFFMPVEKRPLIEFIATEFTSSATEAVCQTIAHSLGKAMLPAKDSPGFVVNRLLVPYLNQSLLMLERGVDANQLADAAMLFGMPLSPLKLMDTIGIRTAFDSGRIFWQSFPDRLDPAPILPGMIKAKRLGLATGGGFFESNEPNSHHDEKAMAIHPAALAVIARYQRGSQAWSTEEVAHTIALPMWIEAAEVLATGIVDRLEDIELAMRGGLGYGRTEGFFGYFDKLGRQQILLLLENYGSMFRALKAKESLANALRQSDTPKSAIQEYRASKRSEWKRPESTSFEVTP